MTYGMEISGEMTKLMTNNNNGMTTDVQIVGNNLDEVESLKYFGAIISEECSKPENVLQKRSIHSSIVMSENSLIRL